MIVQEHFEINGRDFICTTSDAGRYVVRDGVSYGEACDPAELGRVYTEGGLMPAEDLNADLAEAGRILLGVDA